MARSSNNQPNRNRNWHDIFQRFLAAKLNKIKKNKFWALLILGSSAFVVIAAFLIQVKTVYGDIKTVVKSDYLEESTKVTVKSDLNDLTLFSGSNYFVSDTGNQRQNYGVIEFSNDDIYVHISPISSPCGPDYFVENKLNSEGRTTHIFIPRIPYNSEEKQPDYYRNPGAESSSREAFDYPPTKEDIEYARKERIYEAEHQTDIEDPWPCETDDQRSGLETPVKYQNPGFKIRINNNSVDNLLIHDSYLRVKKSLINPFPYIQFDAGSDFDLPISNQGYGDATNVKMLFNIQKENDKINYNADYKHIIEIPLLKPDVFGSPYFSLSDAKNLKSAFKNEGVPVEKLIKNYERGTYAIRDIASKAGLFGRFTNGHARIVGKLIYTGNVADGTKRTDTINFNFFQNLWKEAIGGDSYYTYNGTYNVKLLKKGNDYNIPVRFSESVEPKTAGKFDLVFHAPAPSYHLFDLVINYNNGKQLVVKNIFLYWFMRNVDLGEYRAFQDKLTLQKRKPNI